MMNFGGDLDTGKGYLSFSSGKKIELTPEEKKEYEDKIKLYRADARMIKKACLKTAAVPALQSVLDWYYSLTDKEQETFDNDSRCFSQTTIINTISRLTSQDPGDIIKESRERVTKKLIHSLRESV